jgi:hypothetical protein
VYKVLPDATANTADTAISTVIDTFVCIIVPEFANTAVVPCRSYATVVADIGGLLSRAAEHTEHISRLLPRKYMILYVVMTETTCIPTRACEALQLNISLVMTATQQSCRRRIVIIF